MGSVNGFYCLWKNSAQWNKTIADLTCSNFMELLAWCLQYVPSNRWVTDAVPIHGTAKKGLIWKSVKNREKQNLH